MVVCLLSIIDVLLIILALDSCPELLHVHAADLENWNHFNFS